MLRESLSSTPISLPDYGLRHAWHSFRCAFSSNRHHLLPVLRGIVPVGCIEQLWNVDVASLIIDVNAYTDPSHHSEPHWHRLRAARHHKPHCLEQLDNSLPFAFTFHHRALKLTAHNCPVDEGHIAASFGLVSLGCQRDGWIHILGCALKCGDEVRRLLLPHLPFPRRRISTRSFRLANRAPKQCASRYRSASVGRRCP